jgi:O-antigen/teichoic acid export membrane protein
LAAAVTVCVALAVFVGMCVWGSSALKLDQPGLIALLTAGALSLLAFYNLSAAALRGLGEIRFSSLIGGQQGGGPLGNVVFLLAVLGSTAYAHLSLKWALLAYVVSFGIALTAAAICLSRAAAATFASASTGLQNSAITPLTLRYAVVTCLPALLVQVLNSIVRQGDLWVAGAFCSGAELALYAGASRAIQLVSIPLGLINLSVMSFIPQYRTQGRMRELEHVLQTTAGWAAIPSFLALLLYLFAPAPTLELFLGPYYRDAAGLLSILSLGQFALVWVGSAELTLVLSGRERPAAAVNAIAAGAIIACGPAVARVHGATGLALLSATIVAGQSLTQWLLARKLLGIWTHASGFPWRRLGSPENLASAAEETTTGDHESRPD